MARARRRNRRNARSDPDPLQQLTRLLRANTRALALGAAALLASTLSYLSSTLLEPLGRLTPRAVVAGLSLIFGILHQRYLEGTIAGLLYAYAASRRGQLSDAIIAHATTTPASPSSRSASIIGAFG